MGPVVYQDVDDVLQYYSGRLPVGYLVMSTRVGIVFSLLPVWGLDGLLRYRKSCE